MCVSGLHFTSGMSERGMDYHGATSVLQVDYFPPHKPALLVKIALTRSRKLDHEPDFITALGQQRDELSVDVRRVLGDEPSNIFSSPFRVAEVDTVWLQRNSSRSEEVEYPGQGGVETRAHLWRVGFSALKWTAAACNGAVAFRG